MPTNTPETDAADYVEALLRIETALWAKCEEIATEFNLTANEVIALAITELHSRLVNVKEGRLLISVDAADARFYTSTLDLHLAEADPVYQRVLDQLSAGPLGQRKSDGT